MSDAQSAGKPLTLSIRRAAALVDVCERTMWNMIDRGDVQTTSIGRKRLVVYASLEALIKKNARREPGNSKTDDNDQANDGLNR